MSIRRTLLVALALAGARAGLLGPTVASAQSPATLAEGAAALPAPRATIGGAQVDLYISVWDAGGKPITGMVARATASSGSADAVTDAGGGLYRVPYTPAATGDAGVTTVTVKGKHPVSKRPIDVLIQVPVAPAPAALGAVASPAKVVLGRDTSATVTAHGVGPGGVTFRSTAGKVVDTTQLPAGVWSARFVPPDDRPPRLALVTFADAANPQRAGHFVLPLHGAIDFPVKGVAGASVMLEVGAERFGPVVLDAEGRGKVPVVVGPGSTTATKITVKDGSETREALDLKIPEGRRLALYPLPTAPADGRVVEVRAFVATATGEPDPGARPTFSASAGSIAAAQSLGGGVFAATWTLPTSGASAKVSVSLGGDVQTDSVDVSLGGPLPKLVSLSANPTSVVGGAKVAVTAAATGSDGRSFESGEPVLDFEGLMWVSMRREGATWVSEGVATQEGPVRATAIWRTPASTNGAAVVTLVPERDVMSDEGTAKVEVWVRTLDVFGAPVAGRKVTVAVEGDTGATVEPAEVVTGPDGAAQVVVTSGKKAGWLGLRARSQDLDQVVTIGQFPGGVAPTAVPPNPTATAAMTTPTVTLTRGGAVAAPALVASPVQTVNLVVQGVAAPGATIELVASSLDGTGKALTAYPPAITTSAGTLSAPETRPDGSVAVKLTIPADHRGPVDVSATAAGREAKVAVGGDDDAASAWGAPVAEPAPAPVPEPVAPAPVPEPAPVVDAPPPPRPPTDFRWFRVRANGVGGTYRYAQTPSSEPGPLLPATLRVGGAEGGAPATPIGMEGDVRLWLDAADVPYLGFQAQLRAASYSISSSTFSNAASDTLWNGSVSALGRYPIDVAGDRYWVGAKAGFTYSDFLSFLGDLEPGSTISFVGLSVPGLGIGPEIGAEVGPVYVVAGYTLGLAGGTQPYSNAFDFEIGVEPTDHFFLNAGVTTVVRDAVLAGADSGLDRGAIDDAALQFKLGVGLSL